MYLTLLFTFVQCSTYKAETFSFVSSHCKKHTLTNKYFGKKILENNGYWYYVHFFKNDITKETINILQENILIHNTYLLFLTPNQVEKISNISLMKRVEPNEKFYNESGPLEEIEQLIVYTTHDYDLKLDNDEYIVKKLFKNGIFIVKIKKNQLTNSLFNQKKYKLIQFLSEIPEVRSILTYKKPIRSNSLMTGFTQKNSLNFQLHTKPQFYYLDRYLNNKGITGKDQVITVVDSPIDFNHAMFRDDNVPIEFNKPLPNHRKFVYYSFDGNMSEWTNLVTEDEHGTHVAGTAAGKSICSDDDEIATSYFNGNAPDAKIHYGGDTDILNLFMIDMETIKSYISTNSWGAQTTYNDLMNNLWGNFAKIYSNYTFIFAAGNGYNKMGNFSIDDPGGSKNILSVGAISDFYETQEKYTISSIKNPSLSFEIDGFYFTDIWSNTTIGTIPGETEILVIDSNKGSQCNIMNKNTKFFLYGNSFDWIEKCKAFDEGQFLMTNDGSKVNELINNDGKVLLTKQFKIDSKKQIKKAVFSSTGPANKGILKPDVMAPGVNIISTKSHSHSDESHGCKKNNQSDYIFMNGTSMSTPNVAGAVALIHQYFNSGMWIDKVILNAPTTRALVINSCSHPLDSSSPDIMFGHGVVDLSTILPIEKDFGVRITYQDNNNNNLLADKYQEPSVSSNGHVISKININKKLNNKKLQITMSYNDEMGNLDSVIPLLRDLDLIVVSPTKKIYLGDHLHNNDTQHVSTNEKIIINYDELEDGEYTIHVYGGDFVDEQITKEEKKQKFAVVASGPIENGYIDFTESLECPCEKCDQSHPGYCICDQNEIGQVCQNKIETVNVNKGSFNVGILEVKRIKFVSDKKIKSIISKSENPGKSSTIWASPECHLSIGSYDTNGVTQINAENDKEIDLNFGTKEVCIAIFNNNDKEATYDIKVINDDPKPTPKKKKSGSSSNGSSDDEPKTSSLVLENFDIDTIYIGGSSIIDINVGYTIMKKARRIFGHFIPPPNFLHTALWVGPSNSNDDTKGAIFVYGKYHSNGNDNTYLSIDGARSYIMTLKEFKEQFNSYDVKKLKPKYKTKLHEFLNDVKMSGNWNADKYNWPTNNCQHFTTQCLKMLRAIRCSPEKNDWSIMPASIFNALISNEN